jgi:FlaA1/EpsC-like NDP-sugar epimerase
VGTANVVDAAGIAGVERFVLISTDKAVHPVSVMGASKWFAEQIVRSQQDGPSILCAVRFGNVLGSRGSVIPTFLRQIARGGPVTVTDPGMTRYFMSIEEAVRLVLQAAAMSEGGEVFTLDMGEPVNVLELALNVIRLSGHIPGHDIQVEIVGLRPGERLVETLVASEEVLGPSAHPAIFMSKPAHPDPIMLRRMLHELEGLIREAKQEELSARLKAAWKERSVLAGEVR